MKQIILCLMFSLGLCSEAKAQTKTLEHNIFLSTGWLSIIDGDHQGSGLTFIPNGSP